MLEACGHTFRFWQTDQQPAFDIFSEFEPDLYIGTTYETDRAIAKNIAMRPQMKVAMFASAWGSLIDEIDKEKYPIVVVNEQEKQRIAELKEKTGKPDFVFIHSSGEYLEATMSGWRSIGVEPVGILNAADIHDYYPVESKPEFECDAAFCGGFWGYKASGLNEYILPLCHPDTRRNIKIFGNQLWPVANYLGYLENEDVKILLSSAKVCMNVSEPHSRDFGFDAIERPFKALACGGFCVSDYVDELRQLYKPDELLMYKHPFEFIDAVRYYSSQKQRQTEFMSHIARKGMIRTLKDHTYYERVSQMLLCFGLNDEANKVKAMKPDIIRRHYTNNICKEVLFDETN